MPFEEADRKMSVEFRAPISYNEDYKRSAFNMSTNNENTEVLLSSERLKSNVSVVEDVSASKDFRRTIPTIREGSNRENMDTSVVSN